MSVIEYIAGKMSPYENAEVLAVLAGDDSTDMLHRARVALARYADRLEGRARQRRTEGRERQILLAQQAYDEVAARLHARGAL